MDDLIKRTIEVLDEHDCPQGTFGKFLGVNDDRVSRLLNERDELRPEMRKLIAAALAFVISLSEGAAPIPVCYHEYGPLEKLWLPLRDNLLLKDTNAAERVASGAATELVK